ncbi:MAG TPA: MazG family protein [Jiangellaceae bacterium]|nr:MazG family protein [Jiangellaceae bacterium]
MADQEAPTGTQLLELVKVMDRLRSPGGCPWDAEQTHQSLATYLVEETYETLEAIEKGDDADLREELGDLLLQVVFHARIGQEHPDSPWSIDDVAGDIVAKLVRRHPHVFATDAGTSAPSAEELNVRWEAMKREEKQRTSAVEGVPLAQPALSLAAKLFHRVEQARLPVTTPEIDLPEMTSADDVGDVLLAVASRAREIGVDAEQALRTATRRYIDQVQAAEGGSPP